MRPTHIDPPINIDAENIYWYVLFDKLIISMTKVLYIEETYAIG
jgi:hypothetical protein